MSRTKKLMAVVVLALGFLVATPKGAFANWWGAESDSTKFGGNTYCREHTGTNSAGKASLEECCKSTRDEAKCLETTRLYQASLPSTGSCSDSKCVKTNLIYNTKDSSSGETCFCGDDDGTAIQGILMSVVNIFSGVVLIVAVVGLSIAGIQYLTARDNEGQVAKAKMRIFQIVLGLLVYTLLWAFLNWLVPGGLF